jgi:predicted enzyme related to lactoylglutathione lyase
MSTTRFDLVTIDTPDVDRLAAFWVSVLDLHEVEREDGSRWVVLADAAGVRRLGLQRGAHRPGGMHLDLVCSLAAFDSEMTRLLALGGVVVSTARAEPYGRIVNLADPDGNVFDLCAYD